ncbi:MAG TPA: PPE domain-containing protein [Actinophytocola sp.]|uniref:PPE domain-containing protein n=1 Tax=Actinophytocola sp. TaxID=1872138 RepID=UPI002DBBD411|nr:PPE domain-containing protein [Actinophytocola sp.]HEU5474041.1 PPE domain-containing protein [Actinophytocola sp.]
MDGDYGLADLRFEGYDNHALAEQVDGLRGGQGSESFQGAARALISLAGGLAETDRVLRQQLAELGVSWQGKASEGGTQATQTAAVYAEEAAEPVGESATRVASQSVSFGHARNSAPDAGTLRGPTQLTGMDQFAGMLGHTTDHAKQVQATGAAREQAVAGLNGYQQGSSDALGRVKTLPVPPGMGLSTAPSGNTGPGGGPIPGFNPGGGGFPPGTGPIPGPGTGPLPPPGTQPPPPPGGGEPGPPGQGPGQGPGQQPGQPGQPGNRSGIGPVVPLGGGLPPTGNPPAGPRVLPSLLAANTAALAGAGAQGAALGAGAEKDRVVRRPGAPGTPESTRAAPKSPAAGVPDEESRPVRNAEKYSAKPGKPVSNSILQPATTGSARGDEDSEHVRKYGIDSGDLFEDDRMTAPALIGDEDERAD